MEEGNHLNLTLGLSLFALQLAIVFIVSHTLKHKAPRIATFMPESSCAVAVGVISALCLPSSLLTPFEPSVFFFGLLPPIIFGAGYHIHRRLFWRCVYPITILSCLGTCVSTVFVASALMLAIRYSVLTTEIPFDGFELVAWAALISSTDPVSCLSLFERLKVEPDLHSTILGESLLNDAIAITLFRTATSFINQGDSVWGAAALDFSLEFLKCLFLSIILGYVLGLLSALLFKYVHFDSKASTPALALLTATQVLPYYLAEALRLSGIVTILFTGIACRRYVKKNLPLAAQSGLSDMLILLSTLAEVSIFLLLGLSTPSALSLSSFSWRWSLACVVVVTIGRAVSVYPLLLVYNACIVALHGQQGPPGGARQSTAFTTLPCSDTSSGKCSASGSDPASALVSSSSGASSSSGPEAQVHYVLPVSHLHMVALAGLRGAVAFACSQLFSDANGHKELVLSMTTVVILSTLVVQGAFTEKFVGLLKISTGVDVNAFERSVKDLRQGHGHGTDGRENGGLLSACTSSCIPADDSNSWARDFELWPAACSPSGGGGGGRHATYDSISLLGLTQAPGNTNTTMVTDYLGADDTLSPIGNNAEAEAAAAAALASPRPRRERKSKRGPAFHMDLEQRWLYPLVLSEQALARVVARTPRRGPSLSSSSSFSSAPGSASGSASGSSPLQASRAGPPISVRVGRGLLGSLGDREEWQRGLDTSGGGRHDSEEEDEEGGGRPGPRYSPSHSSKLVMDV